MIVLGCPLQNRGWVLPHYLKAISDLDYDKSQIALCFLLNDSTDNTKDLLLEFRKQHEKEYSQIIIKNILFGLPPEDRNKGRNAQSFHHFAHIRNRWSEIVRTIPEAEWVFSVDSDIIIPANSLKKLLENNKDICSMLANNTQHRLGVGRDCFNILRLNPISPNNYKHIIDFPLNSLIEVDVTGASYLIRRKVLDNTVYEWHRQGEDVGFCINAKKNGYKIWCDTSLIGNHIMNKNLLKELGL